MKKLYIIILSLMLTSCTTMHCTSDVDCEKTVDKKKTFKVLRSIISNGISLD